VTFQIFEIKNTHPTIAIICFVLLQVQKSFGCFKFLFARPKINLHILCQSQTFCAKPKDYSLLVNSLLSAKYNFIFSSDPKFGLAQNILGLVERLVCLYSKVLI
jgi:hypothetical protein